MSKNLLIVESPAKAKTIEKILGKDFQVNSCNRPSFANAADPELAERLYLRVADELREAGVPTQTGVFGAHMDVALLNDGPVTFTLSARDGSLPR
jgi:D-tyrosyl-tRNA(Tyr) deacylase